MNYFPRVYTVSAALLVKRRHKEHNGSVLVEVLSDYHLKHRLITETALRSSLAQSFDEVLIQNN